MTLTVRSATVTGATTKGSALTHAEMDENFNHLSQAANITVTQSGSGAASEDMQTAMRRWVHVDSYAEGDGTTNDKTAIANAIAATAPGGHLFFDPSKTYLVQTDGGAGISIPKPLTVHFGGCTIKHISNSSTENDAIRCESTLGSSETWTETINAGTSTLTIVTSVAAGDMILIELGEHPNDSGIAHYYKICRVLTNTGSVITIDDVIPYNINDTGHVLYPISSLAENIRLLGVNINQVGPHSANPNQSLRFIAARNCFVDTYTHYDVGVGVGTNRGAENIYVANQRGNVKQHGAVTTHGRATTTYGSRNVRIENQVVHSTVDTSMNFSEGSSQEITFGTVIASFNTSAVTANRVYRATGVNTMRFDKISVASVNGVRVGTKTNSSEVEIGELDIKTSLVKEALLRDVQHKLTYNGTAYRAPRVLEKTFTFVGALSGTNFNLCVGLMRRLSIWCDSTTGVTSVLIREVAGSGGLTITGQLVAGSWVDIATVDQLNSDGTASLNNVNNLDKFFRITTDATCNSTFRIRMEYFPSGEDAGASSQLIHGATSGVGTVTVPLTTGLVPVGILNRNTTAVGNVGTGEDNLMTYAMPPVFTANGKGVRVTAWGTYANNGDAKTLKLYFGGTAISTQSLTTSESGDWEMTALVFRTGVDAQDYKVKFIQEGTTDVTDLSKGTLTEDDGAAITIKCTGEATSNNDIVQEGMLVEALG